MMIEQQQSQEPPIAETAVRQSIVVQAPQERAFAIFTERMGSWWPLHSYALGAQPVVDAIVEPRSGGRWYERSEDGSEIERGRVLAWEPPDRVVLTWELSADFRPDPRIQTEVELRFSPDGAHRTRVELEHRGLEAYGERTAEMRETYGSDGGWAGLLRAYAATAESGA
jgi:uncharacterized protein YndB with AHSA1/START domain